MATGKTRQLTVLMETAALITSSLETSEITKRAIESAMKLLEAEAGSLLLVDRKDHDLIFDVTLGGNEKILKETRLACGRGVAGWVAEHGISQLVTDVAQDPRWCRDVDASSRFATREIACVPVMFKDTMIGVLEAINKRNGGFDNEDLQILEALANQVAIALENARLYEENSQQYERMLANEKRYQEEKEKLLKDLHDGIGGLTTNINLLSELGQKATTTDDMKKTLAAIAELSREGMGEIRMFMNALEDREAGWTDLAAEMRCYGRSMAEPHSIDFSIDTTIDSCDTLPGVFLYLSLFRMYKEALANVIKHARATSTAVTFAVSPTLVSLLIRDNGIGFCNSARTGRGIANMMARAREIGGELRISSENGTLISVEFPLPLPSGLGADNARREEVCV
ncbi:MAG: GAF domain-containing protein [Verrucomicrobia bacterium]|nr:GAF domain-containing protein [Deltaproteobacteria bacterium]